MSILGVSGLFQFDQRTAEILRVQEQHRLAMGTDARLPVAQDAGTPGLQAVARLQDVVNLVAEVVDPAARRLGAEPGDRRRLAQRAKQFDPRSAERRVGKECGSSCGYRWM